jgi:hypothetical protein
VNRAEALQVVPHAYATPLRLREEAVEPEPLARVRGVEPEAVGPLLTLAEAKLRM